MGRIAMFVRLQKKLSSLVGIMLASFSKPFLKVCLCVACCVCACVFAACCFQSDPTEMFQSSVIFFLFYLRECTQSAIGSFVFVCSILPKSLRSLEEYPHARVCF